MTQYKEDITGVNLEAPKGTVIFSANSNNQRFCILQKGTLLVNYPFGNNIKKKLFVFKAPAIINIAPILVRKKNVYEIISLEDSVLSSHSFSIKQVQEVLQQKPKLSVLLLKSLFYELNQLISIEQHEQSMENALKDFNFMLSIVYSKLELDLYIPFSISSFLEDKSKQDTFWYKVLQEYKVFLDTKNDVKVAITPEFLSSSLRNNLGLDKSIEIYIPQDFVLLRHFVSLHDNILVAISKNNINLLLELCKKIIAGTFSLLTQWSAIANQNINILNLLFNSSPNWLGNLEKQVNLFNKNECLVHHPELSALHEFFRVSFYSIQNLGLNKFIGFPLDSTQIEAKINQIQKNLNKTEETNKSSSDDQRTIWMSEMKHSVEKIVDWGGISIEEYHKLRASLFSLKKLTTPFDIHEESSRTRKVFIRYHWILYKTIALKFCQEVSKSKTDKNIPKVVKLFLNFGYLDDTLLEDDTLKELYYLQDPSVTQYSVYTMTEWLLKIYNKEISTSINSLGLTYFSLLQDKHSDTDWRNLEEVPEEVDTSEARLMYELDNMLQTNIRLCSGTLSSYLPILTKFNFNRKLKDMFVSKTKLVATLDKLLGIDYSIFFRELSFEDETYGISRQLIQKEIRPIFLLIPCYGSVFQFWQERDGKVKASSGRMNIPYISSIDIFDGLLSVVAIYRWEILKTTLGYDWNNVTKPSLTADYMGYLNFYKKNRLLSSEIKRKITSDIKRMRGDRNMFVNDYKTFIKNEIEGRPNMNKVVRSIFLKYIPLTKVVREKLANIVVYEQDLSRMSNRMSQNANKLNHLLSKLEKANIIPPKEIFDTYKYYKMNF